MELTEQDVANEVAWIRDQDGWPHWPVLPLKNVNHKAVVNTVAEAIESRKVHDGLGILTAIELEPPTVYFMNLFELESGPLRPQLEGRESISFGSIEDMVHAGWIGD